MVDMLLGLDGYDGHGGHIGHDGHSGLATMDMMVELGPLFLSSLPHHRCISYDVLNLETSTLSRC